jgi:hypothetical protein
VFMPLSSDRDPAFEARWAAWIARGAAHDRGERRRVRIAAPVAVIAAIVAYLLFVR